jgi:hypothetical protein
MLLQRDEKYAEENWRETEKISLRLQFRMIYSNFSNVTSLSQKLLSFRSSVDDLLPSQNKYHRSLPYTQYFATTSLEANINLGG